MNESLETFVPLQFQRRKGRLRVDADGPSPDVALIEAVAKAVCWHALLDKGTFNSVAAIAEAEGLTTSTVSRKLRLARLAPDLIEQMLLGEQPRRLTLFWLLRHDIPALWTEQRLLLDQFR
jgi:hypothetical protein